MNGPIGVFLSAALLLALLGCGTGTPAADNHEPSKDDGSSAAVPGQSEHSEEDDTVEQNTFYVSVGGTTFAADFADTTGAQALQELLADGPLSIEMSDYGSFEKVGPLGQSLPTSNRQITTQSGDMMLYQGNQIVLFYGSNSWSYTPLGRVRDLTGWADALGSGDVTVTFSLTTEETEAN